MDADRRDEALTGSALDREIRAALDVDPSPEFLARVRAGIASEPKQAAWRWSWMFAAAGAMAAVIAIAAVVSRSNEMSSMFPADRMPLPARTVAPFSQPLAGSHGIVPVLLVGSGFSWTEPGRTGPGRTEGNPRSTTARSAKAFALQPRETARSAEALALQPREPEILIDPRESVALRRLIAGTRDGTLDLSASLQATTPAAMDLPPVTDLVIAPLTIEALAPIEGAEGVRQ